MYLNESILREKYDFALDADTNVSEALRQIRYRWANQPDNAVIFGGALRSIALGEQPRDLDVVTRDVPVLEGLGRVSENAAGGNKVVIAGVDVDVWTFAETWGVRFLEMHPYRISWYDFLRTSFFNVEAILLDPKTGNVYDRGFFECMATKRLDINLRDNPFPAFQVMRAAVLCCRYGFKCGERLREFVVTEGAKTTPERLWRMQKRHYGSEWVSVDGFKTFVEVGQPG